ncbi:MULTISPECIES: arsenosugar biosynthesis radical SAM (seleno)protein ArsS [unclassified Adlercreutzia]|uniref:arsenosugar biosynthesis radical SAM (seleno)protein ArsS n=1 Tax=unclassified Adlercreutzia TaxID=2636013 RepID=UPI0013EA0A36|nr:MULTISPECIES: arsenosugar biosynthesis radical SAM (seleno)protein ArsS [unclassified Adlercreutzia]
MTEEPNAGGAQGAEESPAEEAQGTGTARAAEGAQGAGRDVAHASLVPSLDASQIPDAELSIHDQVREYYGRILAGSDDLKTNACCCTTDAPPKYVLDVMPEIADEIMERFYGCGSPIPPALEGCTVVDLGCGVGRDVYILSKLVGETGRVIGVDMTPAQLDVARAYQDEQAARFGFTRSNVEFKCGYIEDLAELGIEDGTVDLVVSNCVINLTPFKEQVFSEIYRVLKPGGELYFSDVFCDRRMPPELRDDPVLRGECLGGAIYLDDFRRMMARQGWASYLYTVIDDIHVSDLALETKLGFMGFTSRTVRAIKATGLEDAHESYGQTARYKGTIPEMPRYFDLTDEIRLIKGRDVAISGNMAEMIAQSRYGAHFDIRPRGAHRGAFDFQRAQDAVAARRGKKAVDLAYVDEALARIGEPSFEERVNSPQVLTAPAAPALTTMQVNITYACNLACRHCYLECSPKNDEAMSRETLQACLDAFDAGGFQIMDITGGSPELHPDFSWFLAESARRAQAAGGHVIVRSNLTLLDQAEYAHFIDEYAAAGAHVTASIPYYSPETADAQRGRGVFERAMRVIRQLNERGYGSAEGGLPLDLVYNVSGPFLPPPQDMLADLYREELARREDIAFNDLFAFNNYPLGRFAHDLLDANLFDAYLKLLVENFNALAVQRMMCRSQVNVDVDGRLYDCEVNHVLGLPIQLPVDAGAPDGATRDARVEDLAAGGLPERSLRTHPVCYSCSAGFGSSCGGSLVHEYNAE